MTHPTQMPPDIRWMRALNRGLLAVFVLAVLASGLVWLGRHAMFSLTTVKLDGDMQRNNLATIQANVRPHLSQAQSRYFSINLDNTRAVFENLPWVRQAMVTRIWPNVLHVTLHEHQPAAYWQTGDRDDLMVNTQGEIFEANTGDVDDEDLPTFKSPTEPTAEQAQHMLTMYRLLSPVAQAMAARIDTLRLTDRGSWSIKLDNDTVMELGRGQDNEIVARATRFVQTMSQLRQQYAQGFSFADLRYPNGYAVRFRVDPTALAEPALPDENEIAMPLNSSKSQ